MINMRDVIALLELIDLFEREGLFGLFKSFFESEAVVAFKELVISITDQFKFWTDETFMQGNR